MSDPELQLAYLFVQTSWGHGGPGGAAAYAKQAAALGYAALGCADYGSVAAWPGFDAALRAQGIRPILGLACDVLLDAEFAPETGDGRALQPVLLVAANGAGLRSLVLLHNRLTREVDGRCWCSLDDLAAHAAGCWVVVLAQGEFGPAPLAALPRKKAVALLEGIAGAMPAPDIALLGLPPGPEQDHFAALADESKLAALALPIARYPGPALRAAHRALHPAATWDSEATAALLSPADVAVQYAAHPAAVELACHVAASCHVVEDPATSALAPLRLPQDATAVEQLRTLSAEALVAYGETSGHALELELNAVAELGLAAPLLAAQEIAALGRSLGIYLGGGSGVAAEGRLPALLGVAPANPFGTAPTWLEADARRASLTPGLRVASLARPALVRKLATADLPLAPAGGARGIGFATALRLAGAARGLDPGIIADLVRLSSRGGDGAQALRRAQADDKISPDAVDLAALLDLVAQLVGSPEELLPDAEMLVIVPPQAALPLANGVCSWDAATLDTLGAALVALYGDPELDTVQRALELTGGDWERPEADAMRLVITAGETAGLPLPAVIKPAQADGQAPGVLAADAAALLPDDTESDLGWAVLGALLCGPRGPHPWLSLYVRRRVGQTPYPPLHAALRPILEPTLGLPLFCEQIAAADLRLSHNELIPAAAALQIRTWLGGIEAYALPYGEALAVGRLLGTVLSVKAAHPAAFLAAALQHAQAGGDIATLHRLALEAQSRGSALLLPDVRYSESGFTLETPAPGRGDDAAWAIRWGLALNPRLIPAARAIAATFAGHSAAASLDEFCAELDPAAVTPDMLEELIRAGALDYLGSRLALLASLPAALKQAQRSRSARAVAALGGPSQLDMFVADAEPPIVETNEDGPEAPPDALVPSVEPGVWEAALLGHVFAPQPVVAERLQTAVRQSGITRRTLSDVGVGDAGTTLSVPVAFGSVEIIAAGNERMALAWVEDATGRVPLLLFPPIYERHKALCQPGSAVILTARVRLAEPWEGSGSGVALVCEQLQPYESARAAQILDVKPIKTRRAPPGVTEARPKTEKTPAVAAVPREPTPIQRPVLPEPPKTAGVALPPWLRNGGPTVMLTLPLVGSADEDEWRMRRLKTIMSRHPGNTAVVLFFPEDPEVGMPTHMPLRNIKVDPSDEFCAEAGALLGAECVQVLNGGSNV